MSQLLEANAFESAQLPLLATANDVRELVQFLKKRPSGVSICDISQPIKKRVFYHTKVAAYEYWGIVSKSGEHLKLSPLGWKFAESLEPEAQVYRRLLAQTVPYRSYLEELYRQQVEVITHADVAQYWLEHFPGSLILQDGLVASGPVVCFFHICQAAELGTMTIGKRGQPARLRILRDELRTYLEGRLWSDAEGTHTALSPTHDTLTCRSIKRVFISVSGDEEEFAIQISEFLELNDIDSEIVSRNGSTNMEIVSANALAALRRCQGAIVVAADRDLSTPTQLREQILNEISAAFVLYERRVILMTNKTAAPPAKDLECCTYDAAAPAWDSLCDLLQVIKRWQMVN